MIAVDHLTASVTDALSSGFCPAGKSDFRLKLVVAVLLVCCIGFAVMAAGRRATNSTLRYAARAGTVVVMLFALGGGVWDLFGLAGCGTHATAGLTWDWPW